MMYGRPEPPTAMDFDRSYRDELDREIGLVRHNRGADPGTPRILRAENWWENDELWNQHVEEETGRAL